MLYYIAKLLQALGLTIILIDFIRNFPQLMGYRWLVVGILIFVCGWLVDRLLLRK